MNTNYPSAIEFIKFTLNKFNKLSYAQQILADKRKEKGKAFSAYLIQRYGLGSIVSLENKMLLDYQSHYEKLQNIYNGFIENGQTYFLDKNELIVYAIYDMSEEVKAVAECNFSNLPIMETRRNKSYFADLIEEGIVDVSKNKTDLIRSCNLLNCNSY